MTPSRVSTTTGPGGRGTGPAAMAAAPAGAAAGSASPSATVAIRTILMPPPPRTPVLLAKHPGEVEPILGHQLERSGGLVEGGPFDARAVQARHLPELPLVD